MSKPSKPSDKSSDTVRVYTLAKELELDNKELIQLCQDLGLSKIKNQLNALGQDEVAKIKERLAQGPVGAAPETSKPAPKPAPVAQLIPKNLDTKVRTLAPNKPKVKKESTKPDADEDTAGTSDEPSTADETMVEVEETKPTVVVDEKEEKPTPEAEAPPQAVVEVAAPVEPTAPAPAPTPVAEEPAPAPAEPQPGVENLLNPNRIPNLGARPMGQGQVRNLNARPAAPRPQAPQPPAQAPRPQQQAPAPRPQAPNQGNTGPRPAPTTTGPSAGPSPSAPRGNFPPPRPGAPAPRPGATPPRPGMPTGPARPASTAPTPGGPGKAIKLTPEQIKKMREMEQKRGQKVTTDQVTKAIINEQQAPSGPDAFLQDVAQPQRGQQDRSPIRGPARGGDTAQFEDADGKRGAGKGAAGGSGVIGRDGRHASRQSRDRRGTQATDKGSVIISGGQVDLNEESYGSKKGPRAALMAKLKRRQGQQAAVKKEGPVEITLPITLRSLSEAIGVKLGDLSKQLLKETQQLYGVGSTIEFDVAELIAINKGITLVAKKQKSAKELLLEEFENRAKTVEPEMLRPRPPIVVIMGHVDHGKTTLLDRIREEFGLTSDVVSTEAGGITQVLRAWRVEKDGKPVTFLDTPGHEAFTKMRARGANVTDIAIIVVAATDGVMPQTEEAVAHARAADVDIIVAINKVDMPNADLERTRRQLYQLNLLPDTMGGEVQFVETSAVTGQGVGQLLDAIGLQAELSDPPLLADPEHPASGTCLEAYLDGDRGVMATLLVQQGTLRRGDVILCGATHGRVRAMYDDLGQPIEEAGPSTPVKIFGLDLVPDADDPFYFVESITRAAEIAEKERQIIREQELHKFSPVSLDRLREANTGIKITELKVILKAEARGSVEAIRKELEKLVHEEVRCRVLHAGIGAITEADITLALTSPADTLVIGFNVTADDAALKMAELRGISLREYQIIYNLVDDVKASLEGRLKPIEEVVHLGRAVVRQTFKVSKVGTIAGCYVTSGVIERNARVRVIREGAVIFPPAEKTLGLDSLKRHKDDAKEVREGFECGMKITGFDDVKVGDVIEAYRIDIKTRTM